VALLFRSLISRLKMKSPKKNVTNLGLHFLFVFLIDWCSWVARWEESYFRRNDVRFRRHTCAWVNEAQGNKNSDIPSIVVCQTRFRHTWMELSTIEPLHPIRWRFN